MARFLSGPERDLLLFHDDYQIFGRLVVEGTPLDLILGTNPLRQATVTLDLDQVCQTGVFVCNLLSGSTSLSPYLSTGARLSGEPVLQEDRAVSFQVQCTLPGVPPSEPGWRKIFEGIVDSVSVDPGQGTVTVSCRDRMVRLVRTQIENLSDPGDGSTAWGFAVAAGLIQDGIQTILDTAWGYRYGGTYPDGFAVLGSPTDSATAFWQERVSIMDAIRALGVGKNGWDLRGRWDLPGFGQDSFVLCYYEPDRAGVNDPTIGGFTATRSGGIPYTRLSSLDRSVVGVRNVAEVTPADDARVPVVTENAASIRRYGRAFQAVSEDRASHIDTPTEAGNLGTLITTDLGFPKAAVGLRLPFVWFLELNDLFQVGPDGYCYDQADTVYGATHIEYHYGLGKGYTVLQGRESGAAAAGREWREADQQIAPRATYVSTGPAVGPAKERAIWIQRPA